MKVLKNQKGSTMMVALLGILVVAVAAYGGYRLIQQTTPLGVSDTVSSSSSNVPQTIKSSADLRKASAALDETSIDGDVNPNSMDKELTSLL